MLVEALLLQLNSRLISIQCAAAALLHLVLRNGYEYQLQSGKIGLILLRWLEKLPVNCVLICFYLTLNFYLTNLYNWFLLYQISDSKYFFKIRLKPANR